jgi:DNA-binding GntR family transcriptional regulator
MAIVRPTLARQAYAEIHKKILTGELPGGQRLFAEDLASELAISQTPVKEALALLERDGLVVGQERRGSLVREFTRDDIRQIYEARILLELNAVASGFREGRVDQRFLDQMEESFELQQELAAAPSKAALVEIISLDRGFHEMIVALGRNDVLSGWHQTILWQTQTVRTYSLATYSFERAREEHQSILDALRSGDLQRVTDALFSHLVASRNELLTRVRPGITPES